MAAMSGNDGAALEGLVRSIEEALIPKGFTVTTNRRLVNEDGVQVAEFDIEVRGRLGSAEIAWLIECRDRPGNGSAPGSWIEQLAGRQTLHGFNKVTAVSSSGFSPGARALAHKAGIDLRTLRSVTAEDVAGWLGMRHIDWVVRHSELQAANFGIAKETSPKLIEALLRWIATFDGRSPILRSTETGRVQSAQDVFSGVTTGTTSAQDFFEGIEPDAKEPRCVALRVQYPNDASHFVVDTDLGPVRITEILFRGELRIVTRKVPVQSLHEYKGEGEDGHIAQVAVFPVEVLGRKMTLELHNIPESGFTHVVLRSTKVSTAESHDVELSE